MTALDTINHMAAVLPDPDPTMPPGMEKILDVIGWIKWCALAATIVGVMIAGAMVAIGNSRGGGASEHLPKVLWAILGALIITGATTIIEMFAS